MKSTTTLTRFVIAILVATSIHKASPYMLDEDEQHRDLRGMSSNKTAAAGNPHTPTNCHVVQVILTYDAVSNSPRLDEGATPGARQGAQLAITDVADGVTVIGDYTYLITFLPQVGSQYACIANGAYTFNDGDGNGGGGGGGIKDQITWTGACSNSPYLTITGGSGAYNGAAGYVRILNVVDGVGYRHDIYLCKQPPTFN